jgi:hypothetical protein
MSVTINGTTGIAGTNGSASTPAVQGEDTNTGVFFPAADVIGFAAGGSERVRIDANGIKFNGDTAAANALDDYEEGTWTPTVLYNGSDAGQTYSHQVGTYTKVGRVVHYQAYVQVATNSSATGFLAVGGLPFTSSTTTNVVTTGSAGLDNASSGIDQPVGRVGTNTTQVIIVAGTGANNWTALTESVRGSSFRVYVAGHYITD